MGLYLTIPDMVDSEELVSLSPGSDRVSFTIVMSPSETLMHLMHACTTGQHIPLVVLTTDIQIIALDSVYVTEASMNGGYGQVSLVAQEVRVV
jgi:hypothetical protein